MNSTAAVTRLDKKFSSVAKTFLAKKFPSGVYRPQDVLEAARPKGSPIHGYFEWDDTKAAEQYRLEQARRLIQIVVVTTPVGLMRKYDSVLVTIQGGKKQRRYVDHDIVVSTPDLYEQYIQSGMAQMESWVARFKTVSEFETIRDAYTQTKEQLDAKTKKGRRTKVRKSVRPNGSENTTTFLGDGKTYLGGGYSLVGKSVRRKVKSSDRRRKKVKNSEREKTVR